MITVTVTGMDQVMLRFSEMPAKVRQRVYTVVDGLARQLEAHVKNDKLDGQVLNHITGHLQGSINNQATQSGDSVEGRVYSNPSVNYAGIHEYGFDGVEQVREHIRTVCFGREVAPFTVPAHERHMHMPERSFLRSGLQDMRDKIINDITAAVKEACQ